MSLRTHCHEELESVSLSLLHDEVGPIVMTVAKGRLQLHCATGRC